MRLTNDATFNATTTDPFRFALDHGFSDLHIKVDKNTGMQAIIAIHNTKLGPALGGCRFIPYPNTTSAIVDAMRLARGMSYKSALANLPIGGGKAVIIQPSHPYDRKAYFHLFGEFIHSLQGRYITALDSGTVLADMDIIAQHTPHVASLSCYQGDPSPYTAKGVLRGIQAAVLFKLEKNILQGLHVAIQGLGHVGYALANYLFHEGVKLTVADLDPQLTQRASIEFAATVVDVNTIHKVPCDVFAPCALGGVINDQTIHELQTKIIAGGANNQLSDHHIGRFLHEKGILYAPDYVINAGGVIFAANQYLQTPHSLVQQKIDTIKETLLDIFSRSLNENRPVSDIADALAEEKLV
ncbi:MAG: Leu/Phe/Val dehydrogenase [Legionella sp.]